MSQSAGKGPIYGVELIESLPLDGELRQAMPTSNDLKRCKIERVAAGFEVLLDHYRRQSAEIASRDQEIHHLREIIRKNELDAERADRHERELTEIGRMIGCNHIDEGLSRCVREFVSRIKEQEASRS